MSRHRRGTYHAELAYAGLLNRSRHSSLVPVIGLLALLGGAAWLVNRFAPNKEQSSSDGTTRVKRVLAAQVPAQTVYDFFRHPERLSEVIPTLEHVVTNGDDSTWTAKMGEETKQWSMRLQDDRPGQGLTWHTASDAAMQLALIVQIQALPFERGTNIQLVLEFDARARSLFGPIAKHGLQEVLLKTRALLETGETPTTKGQATGQNKVRAMIPGTT
jgi:uncharacterized membrane protein